MSYTTVSDLFKAICDSIRAKTGKSGTINHQDIPAEIDAIETGGGLDLDDVICSPPNITEISSDLTTLNEYAFAGFTLLESVSLPNLTGLCMGCFVGAGDSSKVVSLRLPQVTYSNQAFLNSRFSEIYLPKLATLANYDIRNCSVLKKLRLPAASTIQDYNLDNCPQLTSVDMGKASPTANLFNYINTSLKLIALRKGTVTTLISGWVSSHQSPVAQGTGYVLVPASLVSGYETGTNWATLYAKGTQFLALEDYTTDGTLTGELDETKIDTLLAS